MVTFLFPAFQPCGNTVNEKANEKQYNERLKKKNCHKALL